MSSSVTNLGRAFSSLPALTAYFIGLNVPSGLGINELVNRFKSDATIGQLIQDCFCYTNNGYTNNQNISISGACTNMSLAQQDEFCWNVKVLNYKNGDVEFFLLIGLIVSVALNAFLVHAIICKSINRCCLPKTGERRPLIEESEL